MLPMRPTYIVRAINRLFKLGTAYRIPEAGLIGLDLSNRSDYRYSWRGQDHSAVTWR
jgi:hypothetical protein